MYQIELLEKFGLLKNHIKILNALLSSSGKKLTAKQLSKITGITQSRIYSYLDQMAEWGLVEVSLGKRKEFFISDTETRLREFIGRKEKELHEAEKQLFRGLSLLPQGGGLVVPLYSEEDYYKADYQAVAHAQWIKGLARTPILLLEKYRKTEWRKALYDIYLEQIKSGIPFSYLVDKNFLKTDIRKIDKKQIASLRKEGVDIRIADLKGSISMLITDKEVIIGFRNPKEYKVVRGLLFRSKEMIEFFENYYDDLFEKAAEL